MVSVSINIMVRIMFATCSAKLQKCAGWNNKILWQLRCQKVKERSRKPVYIDYELLISSHSGMAHVNKGSLTCHPRLSTSGMNHTFL